MTFTGPEIARFVASLTDAALVALLDIYRDTPSERRTDAYTLSSQTALAEAARRGV